MAEIKKEKKKEIISKVLSGIKMEDAGKKMNTKEDCCSPVASSDIMYPNLYLDVKQAPGLKDYEVGDKVMMIIEGEVTGHSANEYGNNKRESFDVSIKKLGVKPKEKKE
jgi:hypothetical protein